MAIEKNLGYTDTPITGPIGTSDILVGPLNYKADWRIKTAVPGKEVVLTNITCPVDRPEKLRIAYSEVSNIYTGTGVEPSNYAPTKRGVSLLVQLTETLTVTDPTDPEFRVDLPLSAHLVLKVPASEYFDDGNVLDLVNRLLAGLYDDSEMSNSHIKAMLRGSLDPRDL